MKKKSEPSEKKPRGKGKLIAGVVLIAMGILIFQFLIENITVTPTEYREEYPDAEVGTTWIIYGHLADKNFTVTDSKNVYLYTFEEDKDARISASKDLGENGDEVIVIVKKTDNETTPTEVDHSINPLIVRATGGIFALLGSVFILVGGMQYSGKIGKKKSAKDSDVDSVDLSQLIGSDSSRMETPSTPPFQTPIQMQAQTNITPLNQPPQMSTSSHAAGLSESSMGMPQYPLPQHPTEAPQTPQIPMPPHQFPQTKPSNPTPSTQITASKPPLPISASTTPEEYSKETWTCPNCGAEVDSKYIFCLSCGHKKGG